jgi:hypothetical protein
MKVLRLLPLRDLFDVAPAVAEVADDDPAFGPDDIKVVDNDGLGDHVDDDLEVDIDDLDDLLDDFDDDDHLDENDDRLAGRLYEVDGRCGRVVRNSPPIFMLESEATRERALVIRAGRHNSRATGRVSRWT